MQRRLLQLTAGVLLVGLALGLTSPVQAARLTLSGLVTGLPDRSPLAGFEVCATDSRRSICATTTSEGRYSLSVPSGTYTVVARDPYLYGDWVDASPTGGPVRVDRNRTADIAMRPGARIDVWLQSRDGQPIPDRLTIRAYPVDAKNTVRHDRQSFIGNATPAQGRAYTQVAKLPAGRYVLKVESDGVANSWYPFGTTEAGAERITVAEGEKITVDPLEVGPPSTLVVRSTGPKERPLASEVELFEASGAPAWVHPETRGNTAIFRGLAPGRYRVRHTEYERTGGYVQWHPTGATRSRAQDVVVGEGTTQTVTTRLTYPSLRATTRPRLVRDLNTVTIKHDRWSPKPTYRAYEWYVGGRKKSNPWRDYTFMKDSSKGKTVKACVTAYRAKYATTRVCTKTIRLPRGDW